MTSPGNPRLISSLKLFSKVASAIVIFVGSLVLIGWTVDVPRLKSIFPELVPMNPVTALAFILAGASLGLLGMKQAGPRARRIGKACAFIVALVGLIKLGGYLLVLDISIDQFFFREKLGSQGFYPNRMAPNTALNFFLLGSALLLLDLQTPRRGRRPAQYLTLLATLVSLLALTGYAYGLKPLYGVSSYIPMALNTAIGFAVLCAGVLFARPDQGWMAVITSDNAGGILARRLLPAVIGIPMILGWVRLAGQRAGLYGTEFGVALFALMSIILLTIVVWWSSAALNRTDAERKQAEEEKGKLTAQLQAANKELEAFSYSVSHDLRAPLRHIHGFVEMLKAHAGTQLDVKGQRYMDTIMNSAKRMGNLIDDLLVFSRMAKSEMRMGKVNLDRLAREVMKDLQTDLQGREVVWKIDGLSEAYGDAAMLRQVWINLIGNAVKYSRPRARAEIEIGSQQEEKETVFFVRDNGVGFDPQYAGKLFGVFQRLHSSDEFEGTGIGLANVRRIIHRHGGRTWAEGRLDGGAVFYFSLPKREKEPG